MAMPSLLRHRERGTAAVEMAIVLPVLLFVTAAIIDFGRAFNAQILLSNASREGARMMALGYTPADARQRVDDALAGAVPYAMPPPMPCPAAPSSTDFASVTVSAPSFQWVILGDVSRLFNSAGVPLSPPTISSTGSMRCGG